MIKKLAMINCMMNIFTFSLTSVNLISKKFGLKLYDAEKTTTHGGSMRYFLTKSNLKTTNRLKNYLKIEKKYKIDSISSLKNFAKNCKKNKNIFFNKISEIKKQKFKIYGFGATSKSTTIFKFL